MKSVFVVLLTVSAIGVVLGQLKQVADKEFLVHQKDLLRLFERPSQLNLFKDQADIGKNYKIEENIDNYVNPQAVKKFVQTYKHGVLPKKEVFSVFYPEYLDQAIQLFDAFFFAKDFDTFYKTACWARDHMNDGQFVYALYIAVKHREDCKHFVLPPIYEVYPYLFVHSEVMQKAFEIRMQGEHYAPIGEEAFKVNQTYFIPSNYSGWSFTKTPEEFLSYFTEDIGVNAFNTYWNYDFPFWANSSFYNVKFDRRGELFYYSQHQLMARYHLERLSNGLPEVETFSYLSDNHIVGYETSLRHKNGKEFYNRPEGYVLNEQKREKVIEYERRVQFAVDSGFIFDKDKKKFSIYEQDGIVLLGDLIAATGDSPNKKFYGSLYATIRTIFTCETDPSYQYIMSPHVFEHLQTVLRDPAYYVLYKRIDNLFKAFKSHLPKYTSADLTYPGVTIESLKVDKLVTYFDNFDFGICNAVDVGTSEEIEKVDIRTRQSRLNHKPYSFKVKVNSEHEGKVMVRVFLGPKYDDLGNEYSMEQVKDYMVEMDRFAYKLVTGSNVIERKSSQSSVAVSDKPSYKELVAKIERALSGEEPHYIDENERQCGWPQRLLLPKGKTSGMHFRFFVMVTPFDEKYTGDFSSVPYCGAGRNTIYPDFKAMGYPFDRDFVDRDCYHKTPNMRFEDVVIYHKEDETNQIAKH